MSSSSASGFTALSGIYDALASAMFGTEIRKAQKVWINALPPCDHALIMGGGTGYVLEQLFLSGKVGHATYIDIAPGMIEKTQERIAKACPERQHNVQYITGTIEDIPAGEYDLICTQFFLDLFTQDTVKNVMNTLAVHQKEGWWLYADFAYRTTGPRKFISRGIIQGMYLFFRLTCGIEARQLPNVRPLFTALRYQLAGERQFAGEMIHSILYRKEV